MLDVRRAPALLAMVPMLACSACVPDGLQFRVDERVTITTPRDNAEVRLPLTLDWEVDDFDVVEPGTPVREGAGYFGVFVDATPMGPGKNLDSLRKDDVPCGGDAECTPEGILALRGIYTTTSSEFVLETLPPGSGDGERHRATVVLLDSRGTRIGESRWSVDFRVADQEAQS
jgi:hypothetical protein